MAGFTNRMYAIVNHVVMPATISIRTVEPRSEILKNRSSPPTGGEADSTRTTLPVSVSAMPSPFRPAGRRPRAAGKSGEA